jgi:hypothetical protein
MINIIVLKQLEASSNKFLTYSSQVNTAMSRWVIDYNSQYHMILCAVLIYHILKTHDEFILNYMGLTVCSFYCEI